MCFLPLVYSSNEQIRDLLKDQAPLDLREDDKGVQVMKLSKHVLLDVDDVMSLLIRGNENRSKGGVSRVTRLLCVYWR